MKNWRCVVRVETKSIGYDDVFHGRAHDGCVSVMRKGWDDVPPNLGMGVPCVMSVWIL